MNYDGTQVGTVRADKQGLYILFSCRCRLPQEGLYRVHAVCGKHREDLGICIPLGGSFGMDKRIPAKRLGEGMLAFELVPKDWTPPAAATPKQEHPTVELPMPEPAAEESGEPAPQFVPVSEEEPFEYLDKLEDAHLEIRNDIPGIVIEPEAEI